MSIQIGNLTFKTGFIWTIDTRALAGLHIHVQSIRKYNIFSFWQITYLMCFIQWLLLIAWEAGSDFENIPIFVPISQCWIPSIVSVKEKHALKALQNERRELQKCTVEVIADKGPTYFIGGSPLPKPNRCILDRLSCDDSEVIISAQNVFIPD